jgi:c(7)-type cytochrome triheme protein
MTTRNFMRLAAVAGVLLGGTALAESLPNLPPALPLPQAGDSPGKVTFQHESHVDAAKPVCVECHPRIFGILGRSGQPKPRVVTHAAMEKGEACGACHGKKAFAFDDCTACHAP